jgi:2'-5' RNA ligase
VSLESELRTAHPGQLRLFIAIPFPTGLRTELLKVQGELKALLPAKAAAWTKPEAMHLTLRFLGNVDSASVSELCQRLSSRLAGFTGLDLICERLGCFPDLRFPRVVWGWVHDEAERLE